ncbi:hypothetical protein DV453_004295 [Geotrichum candidum]|nr:hypothetical protein DV453_004295 [Geotrichum candidum]
MDTRALYNCFEATLQADQNIRIQAELELKKAESTPGFIGACLDIVIEPQVADHVKTAAVVYLKNKVNRYWDPMTPVANPIEEEEKPVFRERLIPALVKVAPQCRAVLVKVLNIIVARDFPERWPGLLDQTLALFQASDIDSTRAGLTCLLEMSKHYRWTSGEKRAGLDHLIASSFDGVLNIGNSLINETSNTAGEMLKDILKIYKCATFHELPKSLQDPKSLSQWATLMFNVIKKDLPEEALNLSIEDREVNHWVKCKKWAFANLYRLFYRYAAPRKLSQKHNALYADFSTLFVNNYVPEIMAVYFNQIELWVQQKIWLGRASIYNLLIFIEECINYKDTWAILKPHSKSIVTHVVFPLLCTTDEDIEIFETDPEEYIHKHIDVFDDNSSPDTAAINFLTTLVRKRTKSTLPDVLEFVQGVVSSHVQNIQDLALARQQEGALRIMSAIALLVISKKSPIADKIEPFIAQYVFPDFNSPHGFLRVRACQFLNVYADVEFQNVENTSFAYQCILKCLEDENLPVQIEAALALQPMVKHNEVRAALSSRIPEIMTRLLDLANKIDIDAITGVIEEFVEIFSEQLTPFAVDLATKMCDQLMRLLSELADQQQVEFDAENYDDTANEDKTMTALGVLTTISTLLLALDNANAVVLELEIILKPVIQVVLNHRMADFYVEVFGLIDNCTYCLKSISPTMWALLPEIHAVFKEDAVDYLNELSPCLDNYLQYGAAEIGQTPQLAAIFYDIFNIVLAEDHLGEEDRTVACSVGQRFLLSLEGKVDQYVPLMLNTVITRLQVEKPKRNIPYLVNLLEVILASICYNARATMAILEEKSFTQEFFSAWFDNMEKFTRVYDLKLVIMTMLSLFGLPDGDLPPSIQSNLGQISKGLVAVIGRLPEALKHREEVDKEFDPSQDYAREDDIYDEWNDEEDEEEEGGEGGSTEEYLDFLEQETSNFQVGEGKFFSTLDGLEEEPLSESVLDTVNPFVAVRDMFMNLKNTNEARYIALTSNFTPEEVTILDEATKL